jgi:hypothetical protein
MGKSRLAATKVAWVQAAVANGMLLAQPSEEALETETVAAVRGRTIPDSSISIKVPQAEKRDGMTYFLWSVYQ